MTAPIRLYVSFGQLEPVLVTFVQRSRTKYVNIVPVRWTFTPVDVVADTVRLAGRLPVAFQQPVDLVINGQQKTVLEAVKGSDIEFKAGDMRLIVSDQRTHQLIREQSL